MAKKYWLMKSEPNVYGIDHLKREKVGEWDGVRNYQARNIMRDEMKKGDGVLFYHSNAKPPGVAGLAVVHKESHPDHTSWKKGGDYFDPKSTPDEPRWFMVDIKFVKKFKALIPLDVLKQTKGLEEMMVIRKGARLSVQPVSAKEFKIISKMGEG